MKTLNDILKEFDESEIAKRIADTDSNARAHGIPDYTGRTVHDFFSSEIRLLLEELRFCKEGELNDRINRIIN